MGVRVDLGKMSSARVIRTILLSSVLVLVGSGALWVWTIPRQSRLRLAVGQSNGFYYKLGEVLAESVAESSNVRLDLVKSSGSAENLKLLLANKVDLAIVQSDVAEQTLKQGQADAIANLAQEQIMLVIRNDRRGLFCSSTNESYSPLSFLEGKRVGTGSLNSGISFTAKRLLSAAGLLDSVIHVNVGTQDAINRAKSEELDAFFYVGRLESYAFLQEFLAETPAYSLCSLSLGVANYLTANYPGVYARSSISLGSVGLDPLVPLQDVRAVSVPTLLVARLDVKPGLVKVIAWAILSGQKRFAQFYPELDSGSPKDLLVRGLHSVSQYAFDVYENGDPAQAWKRYIEQNNDLQAGIVLVLLTTLAGYSFKVWRQQQSRKTINYVNEKLVNLSERLEDSPASILAEVDEITDEVRVKYIANRLTDETYAVISKKLQTLQEKCRKNAEDSKRDAILSSLVLFEKWYEAAEVDPLAAEVMMTEMRAQYRDMLLNGQVDIAAFIELTELTLLAVVSTKTRS